MNKVTLTRCREGLRKRGLIQYVKGDRKTKSPLYMLCNITNDVTNDVTNDDTNDVTTHRVYRVIEKETSSNEEVKTLKKKSKIEDQEFASVEIVDEKKGERMDWKAFVEFYNNTVSPYLPKIDSVTDTRRKLVKAVIKKHGKESIPIVLNYVKNSPWHTGRSNGGWQADFNWIFRLDKFTSLLEKAKHHGASNNQANGQLRINSGAVQDQSSDIYKELFGYDGPPDKFEEWFNRKPYGG